MMLHSADAIRSADHDEAKAMIRQNISVSNLWLERAIVAIYRYQTAEEKSDFTTIEDNKVGFNGVDAYILSSFAQQIMTFVKGKFLNPLSAKQYRIARHKMTKYAGQLARIVHAVS